MPASSKAEKLREAREKARAWAIQRKEKSSGTTPKKTLAKTPVKSNVKTLRKALARKDSSSSKMIRDNNNNNNKSVAKDRLRSDDNIEDEEEEETTSPYVRPTRTGRVSTSTRKSTSKSNRDQDHSVSTRKSAKKKSKKKDHPTNDDYETEDDFLDNVDETSKKVQKKLDHPKHEEYETEDDFLDNQDAKKTPSRQRHVETPKTDESPSPIRQSRRQSTHEDDSTVDYSMNDEPQPTRKKRPRSSISSDEDDDDDESKKIKAGPYGTPKWETDGAKVTQASGKKSSGKKEALRQARLKAAEWAKNMSGKKLENQMRHFTDEQPPPPKASTTPSARSRSPMKVVPVKPLERSRSSTASPAARSPSPVSMATSPAPSRSPTPVRSRSPPVPATTPARSRVLSPTVVSATTPGRPRALDDLVSTVNRAAALAKEVSRRGEVGEDKDEEMGEATTTNTPLPSVIRQGDDAAGGQLTESSQPSSFHTPDSQIPPPSQPTYHQPSTASQPTYNQPPTTPWYMNDIPPPSPSQQQQQHQPSPPTNRTRRRSLERRGGRRWSSVQEATVQQKRIQGELNNEDEAIKAAARVFTGEDDAPLHGETCVGSGAEEDEAILNAVRVFGGGGGGGGGSRVVDLAYRETPVVGYDDRLRTPGRPTSSSSLASREQSLAAREQADAERNNQLMETYNAAIAKRVQEVNERKRRQEEETEREEAKRRQEEEQQQQQQAAVQRARSFSDDAFEDAQQQENPPMKEGGVYDYPQEVHEEQPSIVWNSLPKAKSVGIVVGGILGILFAIALLYKTVEYASTTDGFSRLSNTTSGNNSLLSSLTRKSPPEKKKTLPPCYFDSTPPHPINTPPFLFRSLGIYTCHDNSDVINYDPCPSNGYCSVGFLQNCTHGFIPNEMHDSCILSNASLAFLDAVKEEITKLTVDFVCGRCAISRYICDVENVDGTPWFNVSLFLSASEIGLFDSLWPYVEDEALVYRNGTLSLTKEYREGYLPVSLRCYLSLFMLSLIQSMITMVLSFAGLLIRTFLTSLSAYPLPTSVILLTTIATTYIRRLRAGRKLEHAQTAKLRDIAYEKLLSVNGEYYAVTHLRDDIAHELYPTSMMERQKMKNEIWPRVVKEVRMDSRVTKVPRSVGGVSVEHWQWVSVGRATPKKRE